MMDWNPEGVKAVLKLHRDNPTPDHLAECVECHIVHQRINLFGSGLCHRCINRLYDAGNPRWRCDCSAPGK
jgi:hypothetical protein